MKSREKNIQIFERDVVSNGGYAYTAKERLSCFLSNQRMSNAIGQLVNIKGKTVIDIGCGDGTYTRELMDRGAISILGIDAAEEAVNSAREKTKEFSHVRFEVHDVYKIPKSDPLYDIAIVRGILHHLYNPEDAIEKICKTAKEIVVIEPNGYNPVLKFIEKTSSYHIQHEEKSYSPRKLDGWFMKNNGRIVKRMYIGFVPMFCPDWMASTLKFAEPFVEATPVLRNVCCAQYVQLIRIKM